MTTGLGAAALALGPAWLMTGIGMFGAISYLRAYLQIVTERAAALSGRLAACRFTTRIFRPAS